MEINWISEEDISLVDSDGNTVYCKCGKKVGNAMMSKDSFLARCKDCAYPKWLDIEKMIFVEKCK